MIACGETARRFSSAPEIQSTSLELNVRGWTPGVEPCAETKSSRHCHLGRDARVFTPAGEFPFYVIPLSSPPLVSFPRLSPSQSDFQCPSPRGPFFGLSGRTTRRFSYQFIFPFIVSPSKKSTSTGGENKYGESVFMLSLIVAFSAGRDQEKKDKAGVERA